MKRTIANCHWKTKQNRKHMQQALVGSRGDYVDDYLKTTNSRFIQLEVITLGPQFVYVALMKGGLARNNAIGD